MPAHLTRWQKRANFIQNEIQTRRFPSSRALGKLYGVSHKTILRDIKHMKALGHSIRYNQRRKGYDYASPPQPLNLVVVSDRDVLPLHVAGVILAQYQGTPIHEVFQRVMKDIIAKLSVDLQRLLKLYGERILVRPPALAEFDVTLWRSLAECVVDEREVSFTYSKPASPRTGPRQVQPLALVCDGGRWYLYGNDIAKSEPRCFALWRIHDFKEGQKHFTPPTHFDPCFLLEQPIGTLPGSALLDVRLRFAARHAAVLQEREWFPGQKMQVEEDGSVLLCFNTSNPQLLMNWLFTWDTVVEILEPEELKELYRERVEKVLGWMK